MDLGTNLRGFGHKPSWIWAQTFVDLGTNLRGFGHKPASKGQGSGFSTFFIEVFFIGFSGFSLVVQLFPWMWGLQGSGFSLFFFSRARGARVQDFHWRLEGPGFRFFTGFSGFSLFAQVFRARGGRVQVFHCLFFFTGSRGQGSGFSLASRRARVQIFHWFFRFFTVCSGFSGSRGQGSGFSLFFFHGLEGPGFRFFTAVGTPGFRFFTGFVPVGVGALGFRIFTDGGTIFTASRGQGSGFSLASGPQGSGFSLVLCPEAPGFRFFTGVGGSGFRSLDWCRGPRVQVFHCHTLCGQNLLQSTPPCFQKQNTRRR